MLGSSRVAQAIIGVILVAAISATLAVLPSLHLAVPGGSPSGATGQSQRTADAQANVGSEANATATATATVTALAHAMPTATQVPQVPPTATPTRVPPTPTPLPVAGQPLTVRGTVTSVTPSSNTFAVHVSNGGGNYTCTVTSSTLWSGAASSISTLQVGMQVVASGGTYQGGGVVSQVSRVNADT
jgi:hypothetical protein